jgi:hypothetical protein
VIVNKAVYLKRIKIHAKGSLLKLNKRKTWDYGKKKITYNNYFNGST